VVQDAVLLAAVQDFGAHWTLCADILANSRTCGGRLRSPEEVRERFAEITNHELADDSVPAAGSASGGGAGAAAAAALGDRLSKRRKIPTTKKKAGTGPSARPEKTSGSGGVVRTPLAFGSRDMSVYVALIMKMVHSQKMESRDSLRSMAQAGDDSSNGVSTKGHPSQKKALQEAHMRLNAGQNSLKVLMPAQILLHTSRQRAALMQRNQAPPQQQPGKGQMVCRCC